ncbi:MAG: VOC family protein [Rhodoferax sp.]|jgi:catechol 2,3-dioxygenase-like lactoylglutathione lyase family enzyme|nr:VOC family protein [Rhodoferax sp.]
MAILGMNHFTILSGNLDATLAFYCDVLGLHSGRRPPFDFPGAWLYSGDTAVLHVIAGRPLPADPAGVIDHMAFTAQGLADTVTQLQQRAIRFDLRRLVGDGTWQLFCHDPDGARVELDFDATEPAPPGFVD